MLVVTLGNGTLLGPTSFREEDVIELCVGLCQEHPEGVLQLLDTETVLAFPSDFYLMATICHFTVATVWCGKPEKLCIWPLMSACEKLHCCKEKSPLWCASACLGGEMETQPLPSEPHLDNGPQTELTRDLWDLDDDQLWEVLEAVQLEAARREGAAPPHGSSQGLRVPEGGGTADLDNGEVTF